MSDKLVVEFYDLDDLEQPVASVLALYGGDNPSVAATTLSDFFDALDRLAEPRFDDAGLLSARFVVWESTKSASTDRVDFLGVALIPFEAIPEYQVARVYARQMRPYVYFRVDEYTSEEELLEAALILRQETVVTLTIPSRILTGSHAA